MSNKKIILVTAWVTLVAGALYISLFHAEYLTYALEHLRHTSLWLAAAVLLVLGIVRGFTLIPVTYLIALGLLFLPPVPLFIVTLTGILLSSASVYYFFEIVNVSAVFEKKYQTRIEKLRSLLEKNELPIIIAWSAFPLLPTDLICYVCGTLKVDIKKLLTGVLIGEGAISGIYIFLGNHALSLLHTF